ncbi:hypothetical protein ACFFRR_004303 [Megaselia abdita]
MKFAIITILIALPSVFSEEGWNVPQEDGTFKWVSKETIEEYRNKFENIPEGRKKQEKFYLYTPENGNTPEEVSSDHHFNTDRETRIIVHGWKNDYKSDVNNVLRKAYNDVGLYNIIIVDWNYVARKTYIQASNQIRNVAHKIATFIDQSTLSVQKVAIVGHSLGGHITGLAARYVEKGEIQAVWALDAAGPLFSYDDLSWRVCKTDANYVECIHTNAGTLGFTENLGQADFYVNGGKSQPGCGLDLSGSCAHSRAYEYFAESIRDNNFVSSSCTGYQNAMKNKCTVQLGSHGNMGYGYVNSSGCYYTPVNKKSPFGKGFL